MDDFLTKALAQRRSLEATLTDLRAAYEHRPSPELAEMIRQLEAEISDRKLADKSRGRVLLDKPHSLPPLGEGKEFMVHRRITEPEILPLEENISIKAVFADFCAGLYVQNENVHVTFASIVPDHSQEAAPSRRVVSARVVMPIAGAVELRDLLTQLFDALTAHGTSVPKPSEPTTVTPLRRPDQQ